MPPTSVGDPTCRIESLTAAPSPGLVVGSSARAFSGHTARSGGSDASVRLRAMWLSPTSDTWSNRSNARDRRTLPWTTATSNRGPPARGSGMRAGAATTTVPTTARATALHRDRRSNETAPRTSALTRTITNVTPQTPVTEASGSNRPSPCWVLPSAPQVNPPTGHVARIQSRMVHKAAAETADSPAAETADRGAETTEPTGPPLRHNSGRRAPNRATYADWVITSGAHAISPNGRSHARSAP